MGAAFTKTFLVVGLTSLSLGLGTSLTDAGAAPLPDNCTKVRGTVTCTTFEGPGNNQAGVGTTTSNETQTQHDQRVADPQDLEQTQSCNPATSQGHPCNP